MTMNSDNEILARKIDETRVDVKTLHPLMQLLDTPESNPAADFASRLMTLLTDMRNELRTVSLAVQELQLKASPTRTDQESPGFETRIVELESLLKPLPSLLETALKQQTETKDRLSRMEDLVQEMHQIFGQTPT